MVRSPNMTGLASEFFVKFARFEFALKHFPAFRTGSATRVDPNWDAFASCHEIAPLFKTLAANQRIAYLIAAPPKKRVLQHSTLDWRLVGPATNMVELVLAIRRVRNNLFHGDKTNPRLSRNQRLFRASIALMDAMLDAHHDVRMVFMNDLTNA